MDQTHSASINSNEKFFPAKGIISEHQPLNVGTNRTFSSNSSIIRQKCLKKYGKRYFFQESQKRTPPMLYTFPGSGNTWCRLLVEYSIGIFSGKKYFDLLLHRLSCFSILLHLSFSLNAYMSVMLSMSLSMCFYICLDIKSFLRYLSLLILKQID